MIQNKRQERERERERDGSLRALFAVSAVLLGAAPSVSAQHFSLDGESWSVVNGACECSAGSLFTITEGDILMPTTPPGLVVNTSSPCTFVPNCNSNDGPRTPTIFIFDANPGTGAWHLGLSNIGPPCHMVQDVSWCGLWYVPQGGCKVEVDALSYGRSGIKSFPWQWSAGWIKFSVDRLSTGVPASAILPYRCVPTVTSEAPTGEAHADIFVDALGLPFPPPIQPGTLLSIGNVGAVDGNGCRNPDTHFQYSAVGLVEIGLLDGDNVDAMETVPLVGGCPVYFSLDKLSAENQGQGWSAADILVTDLVGNTTVFRTAAQLGLDRDLDDIDALAIGLDSSQAPYPCHIPPGETPIGILFSVTRDSNIVGQPDSNFGAPIEPGDILQPSLSPATDPNPGIYIPAELLGLVASRGDPQITSDDLDALAISHRLGDEILDCNGNGLEDAAEIAFGAATDCNANGIPDVCEPALDGDGNGIIDACEGPGPLDPYCFGDNSSGNTLCPCGNPGSAGHGCANSTGAGALLSGYGSRWIAPQECTPLVLTASQVPPNASCLFFQGDVQLTGPQGDSGDPFGDGLRCAGTNVIRIEIVTSDGNGTASTTVNVAAAGLVGVGDTKYYQVRYRDPAGQGSPCGAGFNLTNGLRITWN